MQDPTSLRNPGLPSHLDMAYPSSAPHSGEGEHDYSYTKAPQFPTVQLQSTFNIPYYHSEPSRYSRDSEYPPPPSNGGNGEHEFVVQETYSRSAVLAHAPAMVAVGEGVYQQQERWDDLQPRLALPQYDYTRRASEAAYPYDRHGGPSPMPASPAPPRPGSADGYFYVAPASNTVASHLAAPVERDAPLYYTYGGYTSQPTYNSPAPYSYGHSTADKSSAIDELTPAVSPFTSAAIRTGLASAPPVYERDTSNTEERSFKCDQCPHAFHRNHDLKRHKRIHLEIKPYPCHWCSKRFTRKDALKRHLLVKQHPAAPAEPPTAVPKRIYKNGASRGPTTSSPLFQQNVMGPNHTNSAISSVASSRRGSEGSDGSSNSNDDGGDDLEYRPVASNHTQHHLNQHSSSPQYHPDQHNGPYNNSHSQADQLPLLPTITMSTRGATRAASSLAGEAVQADLSGETLIPQYEYAPRAIGSEAVEAGLGIHTVVLGGDAPDGATPYQPFYPPLPADQFPTLA